MMGTLPTVFWIGFAALWVLVLLHTLVLLEVVRRLGRVNPGLNDPIAQDRLPTGTGAPTFTSRDLRSGEQFASTSLVGRALSLVFVGPRCSGCTALAQELSGPAKPTEPMAMVCVGSAPDCAEFSRRYPFTFPLLLDESGELAQEYKVRTTPTVVQIDRDWNILRYGTPQQLQG